MNNGNVSFSIAVCQMSGKPSLLTIPEVGAHACKAVPVVVVSHACLKTDLFKSLSSKVVKQKVRAVVVGHKDIRKAVAVIVGKSDSHSLAPHAWRYRSPPKHR